MAIFNPYLGLNLDDLKHKSDIMSELFKKKRMIFIDNEIDSDLATLVISKMMYLNEQSHDDIYLMIDSPGGSINAGNKIYDYMKFACKSNVVTVATGIAASMAAILLATGKKGKRYATPSSEIMIHQPLGGIYGQATEMIIATNHILKAKEKLTKKIAEACCKDIEVVLEDMERDYWMDAEEAKAYGIIDCIGFPEELKEI